jgi:TRAP-type mannitol/chloroaromatic compound transport system permease small subunit
MRFVFNAPSMWAFESSMMVGTSLYVLAWSYVYRYRAHVRVDVIYSLLPRRMKTLIDVLGTLIMFFPLVILIIYSAFNWTVYSWTINEKMTETYWLPPIAPLRTVVLLAIILLLFQGVAHFIRDSYLLVRNKPYD